MVFDLICRRCGSCEQKSWDPTAAITVTECPACDHGMTVIGIDFPRDQPSVMLRNVLEVIQGAGMMPITVERHGRPDALSHRLLPDAA